MSRLPILALSAAFALQAVTLAAADAKRVFEAVANAVVFIKTDKGLGTGFILSPDGTIATALHVLDAADTVAIKLQNGDVYDDVAILAQDERRDVVLLKVNGFGLPTVATGDSSEVSPGDHIFVIGNPLGAEELKTSISDGIVSGVRDFNAGYKVIQMTAPVSPGNSGGPAINDKAEVIGLVVFRLINGENLNFAVPINYVRGLLASIDKSVRPLKRWTATIASKDLFSRNALAAHVRWKLVETGAIFTLRFQNEYIYAEREESEDRRKLGLFYTAELKTTGDKYSGTAHSNWVYWRTNIYTGEKVVVSRCTFEFPMEFLRVSPERIEGRTFRPSDTAKVDRKHCTLSGSPVWRDFVLIPE